jgi:Zn-dependent protease
VAICFRVEDLKFGLVIGAVLLSSVLAHEFGHIVAARRTGGAGNEILMCPWGGLAFVQPGGTVGAHLAAAAGGPAVNLAVCAITAVGVFGSHAASTVLNPFVLPLGDFSGPPLPALLLLTFWVNWVLFVLNLIPVYPLDGGRILKTLLAVRWDGETATRVYVKVGMILGVLGMLAAVMADMSWGVVFSAMIVILNLHETMQIRTSESYDESFMGYDFSQGYTSLERSAGAVAEKRPGALRRWFRRRQAERERRQAERDAEVEQQLDALLEKVHTLGIESLSSAERRQLARASARYRDKGKRLP